MLGMEPQYFLGTVQYVSIALSIDNCQVPNMTSNVCPDS